LLVGDHPGSASRVRACWRRRRNLTVIREAGDAEEAMPPCSLIRTWWSSTWRTQGGRATGDGGLPKAEEFFSAAMQIACTAPSAGGGPGGGFYRWSRRILLARAGNIWVLVVRRICNWRGGCGSWTRLAEPRLDPRTARGGPALTPRERAQVFAHTDAEALLER